ncbi:MAG: succinyl-diaminopimelate desuccinylase [Rhodospirillaceae bacterium]|jgi:succinyl-diaminopimelate desuccinylase|nr:succinyl-diaminopimelate desuccinylase [Rhodospirillaceae bacterium]MBT5811562.1 succinyl-diaminopimelate desuccinylase [Rhodospirillaceae bacterium]
MIDPVELARDLIQCPSVTPVEGGALDLLQRTLEGMGFTCHRLLFSEDGTPDVDNLYARLGDSRPNFCFAGHTDVVPTGPVDEWSADPFAADIRDGVLYGRGASDMKGAIAAFTAAVERVLEKGAPGKGGLDGSISFLITGDEEGPSINGTKKMLGWLTERGEALDACIVGEPTNPERLGDMMKIGRRGSMNGFITVKGVQGHTAYPHLADNPAHRIVEMLHALTTKPLDEGSDHFQASTLQISTIDIGNPATNVIPANARAVFNIRFNDLHSSDSLTDWIRKTLDASIGDGGAYDLEVQVSGESFLTPPGKLSDVVSAACRGVLQLQPDLSTTGGTSDARFIKDYCPVVEFGLVGQTMHKIDERADVADIVRLTDIYESIINGYFE